MPELLSAELETFEKHRDQLVGKSEGRFALVYKDQIVGVFDSERDAIAQGYERFGNVPFLVKQVLKVETPENFASSLLAL
jgi:hypothetical protein